MFIVNKNLCFFVTYENINIKKLKNCVVFQSKDDMYDHLSNIYDVPKSDFHNNYLFIRDNRMYHHDRLYSLINENLESFISNCEFD